MIAIVLWWNHQRRHVAGAYAGVVAGSGLGLFLHGVISIAWLAQGQTPTVPGTVGVLVASALLTMGRTATGRKCGPPRAIG